MALDLHRPLDDLDPARRPSFALALVPVLAVVCFLGIGGLTGSAWTITVVVAALALGGLLERTGVLAVLAHRLSQGVRSSGGLIAGTGLSAILINALTAQQYMSIVLPGMTLRNLYAEFGLDSAELSWAVEAAGTPTGALLPWHAGGVFMASATGVATLEDAPFYRRPLAAGAVRHGAVRARRADDPTGRPGPAR